MLLYLVALLSEGGGAFQLLEGVREGVTVRSYYLPSLDIFIGDLQQGSVVLQRVDGQSRVCCKLYSLLMVKLSRVKRLSVVGGLILPRMMVSERSLIQLLAIVEEMLSVFDVSLQLL